jgi:hypothetical protein
VPTKILDVRQVIIRDAHGSVRAALGAVGDRVGVAVGGFDGSSAVTAALGPDGSPRIGLHRAGREGVVAGLLPDASPTISVNDRSNRPRLTLGVAAHGAFAFLLDTAGRRRGSAGHGDTGTADIVLTDANQTRRAVAAVPADGVPVAALYDAKAFPRAFIALDATGDAEVNLSGPDLQTLFSKP